MNETDYNLKLTACSEFIDKAALIAEYRNTEGALARCLLQKARIVDLAADSTPVQRQESDQWRLRASTLLLRVHIAGEIMLPERQSENAYDYLVPGEER